MSNYTKTTNFATKDNLSPGNPLKIVKGAEIDTEYNNIATAVATKTDNSAAAITGGTIVGITDLAVADGGTGASTAAGALNNLLPSQTSNANKYLQTDGTNASWDAISLSAADITGTLPVANGGTGVTSSTGTGNVVLSNSPTLVTPALGTPSALVGTNITGTASGLTAGNVTTNANLTGAVTSVGNATSLGSFSSSDLASALTDETGSGANVFATSPTLVTPILGTPTSATLTNATGLPISTGVSGLGTGVATFLGTPSSANLASAVTDETGSGALVFANSPTLVTPALGTPASGVATNLTGLPLSTGVTGTLPVANGGTGTATPSIVAGTNVTVTGTWPNQTIAAAGGGGTPGGSTTEVQYNNAGVFGGITGATTNGTALTLVAPVLGTPASATLTNATGLPLGTGVTGTLPIANGGTGASTLAGANIPVTSAANTFSATQTFAGSSSVLAEILSNAAEIATVSATAATGTINYDVTTQSVIYYTSNASANWTVNFRASSGTSLNTAMSTGQSVTAAFLVTNGATAYYNSVVQVDGTTVTPKYQGGTAWAAGNASSVDVYMYTIIKTGNAAFTVFTSQTKFA
jgi:hypothetical protein